MRMPLLGRVSRVLARLRPHATILLYHRVARERHDPWGQCVAPERFAEQMEVLAATAEVVPLASLPDAIGRRRSARPMVALTFDDGYLDNLQSAKPILEHYGLPATVFLVSGWLGRSRLFWWDELTRLVFEPVTLPEKLTLEIAGRRFHWRDRDGTRQTLHDRLWRYPAPLLDACQQDALEQVAYLGARTPRPTADGTRPLEPDEALRLADGGLIEIGAHSETPSAPRPARAGRPGPRNRGQQARHSRSCSDKRIDGFSFPYGARGREAARNRASGRLRARLQLQGPSAVNTHQPAGTAAHRRRRLGRRHLRAAAERAVLMVGTAGTCSRAGLGDHDLPRCRALHRGGDRERVRADLSAIGSCCWSMMARATAAPRSRVALPPGIRRACATSSTPATPISA